MHVLSSETLFFLVAGILAVAALQFYRRKKCCSNRCFDANEAPGTSAMIYCNRCNHYTCHVSEPSASITDSLFELEYTCTCCRHSHTTLLDL